MGNTGLEVIKQNPFSVRGGEAEPLEELFGKKAVQGSVSEMVEITPHHFRKSSGEWELALKNMPPICASRITYFS